MMRCLSSKQTLVALRVLRLQKQAMPPLGRCLAALSGIYALYQDRSQQYVIEKTWGAPCEMQSD